MASLSINSLLTCQGQIQDLSKRGADHDEHRAQAYKTGLMGRAPSGVEGVRGEAPWSWKPFVHFRTKGGN